MDLDDDDDFFSDDDLSTLPPATLHDLERKALQSTQTRLPRLRDTRTAHGDRDDNRLAYVEGPSELAAGGKALDSHYGESLAQHPSSDYGLDDEAEVIDLDAADGTFAGHPQPAKPTRSLGEVSQREQWRQQRYAVPPGPAPAQPQTRPDRAGIQRIPFQPHANSETASVDAQGAEQHRDVGNRHHNEPVQAHSHDVDNLQARIAELEQERDMFQKAAQDARSNALSRAGEVAIVRANHDKVTKEYERRVADMRKQHAEDLARQKALLDVAKKDREMVETNNRFLEHDLAQEVERAKTAKRTLRDSYGNASKGKDAGNASPASTPRKNKSLPFRDGFDDSEVMLMSPSRASDRSKPGTPRAGAKRKRTAGERTHSPAQTLPLTAPDKIDEAGKEQPVSEPGEVSRQMPRDTQAEERFEFMQMVLNHRAGPAKDRTLEVLAKHNLPSSGERSMSSLIYDDLTTAVPGEGIEGFRLRFCETLASLWSQSLTENFHAPLYDLTELLQYILVVSPSPLSATLVPKIVPLCINTADLIAFATAKASRNIAGQAPPSTLLRTHIDPSDYLDTLEILALNSSLHKDELGCFWKAMQFEFILTMLHKAQPLSQIKRMLRLLGSSILTSSFGAIIPDAGPTSPQQGRIELDTVDRLTVLLFETPAPREASAPYDDIELLDLRSCVLVLLRGLCRTRHGGRLLATHRLAFGRLVRFLHESVVTLYAYRQRTHDLTSAHVNLTVQLLAHLTSRHADAVDVRSKLASMPGSAHRHLVALSRVAFSDGASVLESGIEPEVAEAAHRMLDEHLSPEEGEAVVEVFSSTRD